MITRNSRLLLLARALAKRAFSPYGPATTFVAERAPMPSSSRTRRTKRAEFVRHRAAAEANPAGGPISVRRVGSVRGATGCWRYATLALLMGAMPFQFAQAGQRPAVVNPAPSPAQIDALAQIILAALQGSGANDPASKLEARLTFAIDQAQANCSTSQAALAQVEGTSGALSPTARRALRSVRDSVSRCQTNGTGTTALRAAQSTLAQGTTLGLAGGTSNYQSTR